MEKLNSFQIDQFLSDYNQISSKFDIQNIYKQFNEDSELRLRDIIKDKYQNINQNTKKLQEHIQKYQDIINQIDLKKPIEIQQRILGLLEEIDFPNLNRKSPIEDIYFEKSKSAQSQSLAIERNQNKQIQIIQTLDGQIGVAYSNFILDQTKKYIFRVRLQTNSSSYNYLLVGIIKEQNKDNSSLQSGICYNERGDLMTINKIVKGNNVYEGGKQNLDKEIEMRIYLAEKMIKVGNYPNYENVAELSNKNLIENNTQYRFAIELFQAAHNLIVTHFSVVLDFDNKM